VVTPDSARLYYRVVGSGADTVIAIHGGPGVDLESIANDFAPLAERHVVVFYDQRGAGRSTLPADTASLTVARQVADLDAVRRHFRIERATLVAHSNGPLLAATYAIAPPRRGAADGVLRAVPPRRGDLWARFGAATAARVDSAEGARMADAMRRLADPASDSAAVRRACREFWAVAMRPRLADPERTLALVRSDLCASDPAGIRYGLASTNPVVMASHGDWDLTAALRTLAVPTLVVHGEDEAIPMDMVEEWTRRCRTRASCGCRTPRTSPTWSRAASCGPRSSASSPRRARAAAGARSV
jgi:proline iminopeptidase